MKNNTCMCPRYTSFPRSFWISVGIVIFFLLCFGLWVLLRPGSPELFATIDNIGQALGWLLGAILCLIGTTFSRRKNTPVRHTGTIEVDQPGMRRWMPLCFCAGIFGEFIGQVIYTYYFLHHLSVFPSLADIGYLSTFPCFLLGIFQLPLRPTSGVTTRFRVVLDSCLFLIAAITCSWYFTLGPTLLQGKESELAKVVGTAYPIFDLILIGCVIILSIRDIPTSLRPAIRLLSIGLLVIVITDSIYAYETLHNTYSNGWQDFGWPLGYLLVALSVQVMHSSITRHSPVSEGSAMQSKRTRGALSLWLSFLPYATVIAVGILTLSIWNAGANDALARGVYLGSLLLALIVFLRQILAIRESQQLNNELEDANERLEVLSVTDPLTGLPNHRALNTVLEQEMERAIRYQRSCSLLFFDLDHFKALNDGYGHPVGDAVLRESATVIRSMLRSVDTVGRWGGEEMVVILPEVQEAEATIIAERVRYALANYTFPYGGGLHVTCSIGVASYPADAHTHQELMIRADQAMYAAKRLGRNQVRTASDPTVQLLTTQIEQKGREDEALLGTVEALAMIVNAREQSMIAHTQQVSTLSYQLALQLNLSKIEAQMIALAGRLHDIGKVATPDAILQKNAPLNEQEREIVQRHATVGAEIVSQIPFLRPLAPLIGGHHERWDGTGYPNQLAAEAIPLGARILSVVDTYVVLTMGHSYQQAQSDEVVVAELRRNAGTQFDLQVVTAFEALLRQKAGSHAGQSLAHVV